MAKTTITITVTGAEKMANDFREVGGRMMDMEPEFEKVIDLMEDTHERHFARLRGRYVRTGATKASLTGRGGGAVRELGPGGLEFGTDIWYAHFLTKAPKDPNSGQVRKDDGYLSAVLVFPKSVQKQIPDMLMGYIVEPYG